MAKKAEAQARNEAITERMRGHFDLANKKLYHEVPELKPDVELLFSTTEWGLRPNHFVDRPRQIARHDLQSRNRFVRLPPAFNLREGYPTEIKFA